MYRRHYRLASDGWHIPEETGRTSPRPVSFFVSRRRYMPSLCERTVSMVRLLISLMLLVCSAPVVWSATYYASPGGSDSGTGAARCTRAQTAGTPLLTINIAVACASGGDTVQLGAGMFVPRQRIDLNQSADSTTRTTLPDHPRRHPARPHGDQQSGGDDPRWHGPRRSVDGLRAPCALHQNPQPGTPQFCGGRHWAVWQYHARGGHG